MDDAAPGSGSFAELLRRFRDRAALSQEELAARAGLTAKAISALERGERRRPYPHTVRSLADVLALDEGERRALTSAARPTAVPGATQAAAAPARLPGHRARRSSWWGGTPSATRCSACCAPARRRLLTLTGPGGVGKTALALAVARDLAADYGPAGVAVVELAPLREARLVLPALARALGVRQLGEPVVDRLAAAIGDRRRLVVLDNLEQVLGVAPEIAELLARCPGSWCWRRAGRPADPSPSSNGRSTRCRCPHATMRRRSRLPPRPRSSWNGPAPPAARVALTEHTAADVAAICRRLDGLPLALELAAAHARYLPPKELLARLDAAVSSPRSRDLPGTAAHDPGDPRLEP